MTTSTGEERAFWPIFAREKAAKGESLIGWIEDRKRRKITDPQSAPTALETLERRPLEAPPPADELTPSEKAFVFEAREESLREDEAPTTPFDAPPSAAPEAVAETAAPAEPSILKTSEASVSPDALRAPHAETAPVEAPPAPVPKPSLFQRLRDGLKRSAESLGGGIGQIFSQRKIDAATLEELEDLLITSDLGVPMAARLTAALRETRVGKETSETDIRRILADEVARVLKPAALPFTVDPLKKPFVVLVVGVNGTGKTTTIGKLAHKLRAEGRSVMMAAGDTFRAAAIEQLKVWGERTGATVMAREVGADAAGLAFDALERAQAEGQDVLLIDTAGRLQNKTALMAELEKVIRVLQKRDATAPHAVLQVLDATTGQNAVLQVEAFQKTAKVTGLIMTKLDGTARGGILVPLTEKFGLPVHAIGVGEAVEDLQPFDAELFARALSGLDEAA